jgi:hypothetical protein
MGMQLIETIEIGSGGASSMEFTSIPQDATDLLVVFSTRCSTTQRNFKISVNGLTSGYVTAYLEGNGSGTVTTSSITTEYWKAIQSESSHDGFSSGTCYIPNYTDANRKCCSIDVVTEDNAQLSYQYLGAGGGTITSAITSLKLQTGAGVMQQNSTASLYKITAD